MAVDMVASWFTRLSAAMILMMGNVLFSLRMNIPTTCDVSEQRSDMRCNCVLCFFKC